MKRLVLTFLALLAIAALAVAQRKQTFTGVITDNMCDKGDHSGMRMGPTDAECTVACVMVHGASYVLYDGKADYTIERALSPRMHSPVAHEYADIVGAAAYMAGRATHISGVVARGDTLTIR